MVDLLGHHPSIVLWCAHDAPLGDDDRASRARRSRTRDESCRRGARRCSTARPPAPSAALRRHPARRPQLRRWPSGTDTHLWFGWRHGDARRPRRRPARAAPPRPLRVRVRRAVGARHAPSGCSRSAGPTSTGTTSPRTTAWSATSSTAHVPADRREVVRRVARRDPGVPGRAAPAADRGPAPLQGLSRPAASRCSASPIRQPPRVGSAARPRPRARSAATPPSATRAGPCSQWSTRAPATCTSSTTPVDDRRRPRSRSRSTAASAAGSATSPPTAWCSSARRPRRRGRRRGRARPRTRRSRREPLPARHRCEAGRDSPSCDVQHAKRSTIGTLETGVDQSVRVIVNAVHDSSPFRPRPVPA